MVKKILVNAKSGSMQFQPGATRLCRWVYGCTSLGDSRLKPSGVGMSPMRLAARLELRLCTVHPAAAMHKPACRAEMHTSGTPSF